MSEIKYQDFVLSKIGWGIAVILSLFGYVSYYLLVYPNVAGVQMRQDVVSKDNTLIVEQHNIPTPIPIRVQISAPLYLSRFQSTTLLINISNLSIDETIEGTFVLDVYGKILINDVEIEPAPSGNQTDADGDDKDGKHKISFLLKPNETLEKNLRVRMARSKEDDNDVIVFSAYLVEVSTRSTSKFVKVAEIHPEWRGIYEWKGNSWEKNIGACKNKVGYKEDPDQKICAINYPYGSFAESSLSKLLLPPWSGLSSLALVFGVVWLLEQFMLSYGKVKIETLTSKQQWGYASILLLFGAILLSIFTVGIVSVFKSINYSPLVYYGVLVVLIALALICGFFISWFFKSKVLNSNEDKEGVFKSIEKAYRDRDLFRLQEIRDAYNSFDVRYQIANSYYEILDADLKNYKNGMVDWWNSKDYILMLKKTEFFFRESKNLPYIEDFRHELVLLNSANGIKRIRIGWIFIRPEKSENLLYKVIIDELRKLPEKEWGDKDNCEKLSKLLAEEDLSDTFKSFEKELRDLESKYCKKQEDDSKVQTEQ